MIYNFDVSSRLCIFNLHIMILYAQLFGIIVYKMAFFIRYEILSVAKFQN
jgi:hypothetical protein